MVTVNKTIIAILIIILSINFSFSQNSKQDYQADTMHINSLVKIARTIVFIYPDSTLLYLDTIGQLAAKTNYELGIYNYYNLNGIIYGILKNQKAAIESYRNGLIKIKSDNFPRRKAILMSNIGLEYWRLYEMDSASHYFEKTIAYCDKNDVEDIKTKCLFDLGNVYLDKENFVEAAKNLFNVRELLQKTKDSVLQVYLYGSIGILYTKVGNFKLALKNYQKSIEIDKEIDEVNNIANSYNNIGQLYFNLNQEYDSAIYYYNKSVEYALPHLKHNFTLMSNINTGNVYFEEKKYDTAYYYYDMAYHDTLINYYPDRKSAILVNFGVYYKFNNNFEKARKFLIDGIAMSDSINALSFKATGLRNLYQIDSAQSNYIQTIKNMREYYSTLELIQVSSDKQKIASLEFDKYLAEQKYNNQILVRENELNNKLIYNQKILLWVFILALVLLLLVLALVINGRRKRKLLLYKLYQKNKELQDANEELLIINETLSEQREVLNQLNLTKDKFFSIIGHDLKSPFNVLLGLLQMLDEEWESFEEDDRRGHIHALYQSSLNTYKLLEDILVWGKAQQGVLDYLPKTFPVLQEVQAVKELFVVQLEQKNIELDIEIDRNDELVTDVRYFSQLLQNLLVNAIKFTHNGGRIIIRGTLNHDLKEICVSDNGIGIPENQLEKIFKIDSDFSRPGTNNEKSTGMGLILCKEYADLINAKLSVTSEIGDDKHTGGSRFCITFD